VHVIQTARPSPRFTNHQSAWTERADRSAHHFFSSSNFLVRVCFRFRFLMCIIL
jgi:hypothetical protein